MSSASISLSFDAESGFQSASFDLTLDTTTVPSEVRLAPSVLVQNEVGDGNWRTILDQRVRAKTELVIERLAASWAQALVFGDPERMTVNGHAIDEIVHQSDGGWRRAEVPIEWLREGRNEIELFGGGGVWIERTTGPGRSALSLDGGRTWDRWRLNPEGSLAGEYMIRLRLGQHPRSGAMTSAPIDLAGAAGDGPIAPRATLSSLHLEYDAKLPEQTQIVFSIRGGSTPTYTPQTWTGWQDPSLWTDEARVGEWLPDQDLRYIQWRAWLATDAPNKTPVLRGVTVKARMEIESSERNGLRVEVLENRTIVRSGIPFHHQERSERLKELRRLWPLDWIVHTGTTELERLALLRNWVKHQWKGWEGRCDRAWNALDILRAPVEDRGMCVQFNTVFVQCALALGFVARAVIINHHFTAEVWSNELGRWVCMDAGAGGGEDGNRNMHYQLGDRMLNTLEVHQAWRNGKKDQLFNAATKPANAGPMGEWADNFCRFFMPMRNNYLDVPQPAESAHGVAQYHYDGYIHWEDDLTNLRSPEYSMQTARVNDMYWTVNEVQLYLQETAQDQQLLLHMATVTPNFRAFQLQVDDGDWVEHPAQYVWTLDHPGNDERFLDGFPREAVERSGRYVWQLHPGSNTLRVRPLNAFGVTGLTSVATVVSES